MSDPYIEAAKKQIQEIDAQISILQCERKELTGLMQSTCEHARQEDLTASRGKDCDDGYGHWWKRPYFVCKACGKVSTQYRGFRE